MADVAASIVGLTTFGIQLLDGIRKLKNFCDNVKDAPEQLQDTIDEIGVMGEIIAVMSPSGSEPSQPAQKALLVHSLELCHKALTSLNDLTDSLQKQLGQRKRWGRVSITLKKDSMDRLIKRLEQCKSLLQLAHQAYMSAQCMTQFDCQKRLLDEIQNGQMALVPGNSTAWTNQSSEHIDRRHGARPRSTLVFCIQTPRWCFSRVIQLTVAQIPAGWTASLQCFRIVTKDDPLMEACRENDIVAVRGLLDAREATLHDCDVDGWTIMDVAMYHGAFEVCRFLYDHGGPVTSDWCAVYCFWGHFLKVAVVESRLGGEPSFARLNRQCINDLEQLGLHDSDDVFEHRPLITLTATESFLSNDRIQSMLDVMFVFNIPELGRIDVFKTLQDMLGNGPLDPDLLNPEAHDGRSLLHVFAMAFTAHCSQNHDLDAVHSLHSFLGVLSRMADCSSIEANLTGQGIWDTWRLFDGFTPLALLLMWRYPVSRFKSKESYLDSVLRSWALAMACCNVDLMRYGELETAAQCRYENVYFRAIRILGFAYGPQPEDWHFLFLAENDHYIGEFWKSVEEPELDMPGAWVEEEDSYSEDER